MPTNPYDDEGSLTVRQLSLLFLALVAVCAVFFSLGFIVGHQRRTPGSAPISQSVSAPSGDVPPTVNPPLEDEPIQSPAPSASSAGTATSASTTTAKTGGASAAPPSSPAATVVAKPGPSLPAAPKREPAQPNPAARVEPASDAGISLQLAASHVRRDAEAMVRLLKARGYAAYLLTPEQAHTSDGLYRVEVGPFRSRDAADHVRQKLSQEGFKSFIRK